MAQGSENLGASEGGYGISAGGDQSAAMHGGTQDDRYAAMREKMQARWSTACEDFERFKARAAGYSQNAAKATDDYARSHPWHVVGAAAGVGALLGWLLARR